MDPSIFQQATALSDALAARWFRPVSDATDEFDISSPARQAAFIAQVAHESAGFSQLVESFNYRIDALAIFSQIPAWMRAQLGRQPGEVSVPLDRQMQIANLAYANRGGNGPASSGDGWRYRGRGLIMITLRGNYVAAGDDLGLDLVSNPDQLTVDAIAARAAAWFWSSHNCNARADAGDFDAITRAINPAMAGQADRDARYRVACTAFGL